LMDTDDDLPLFSQAPAPTRTREAAVITVTELNRRARNLLEANLELLWVRGELSNVVRAASGHWYFSLKDDAAQVRCVMFRNRAQGLGFNPEAGMQVEIRALPSLYEPRGDFQLGVEQMRRAGQGALSEAFEKLKAKLAREGLFEAENKKPLPAFPRAIGIVTSLQAAALRDVLSTLKRRAPMIPVVIYPTAVQGAIAALDVARAIDTVTSRGEVEVLIICRGGGAIEDLWSFNEEVVARSIARLRERTDIPVVSGVGHETDFTICDFVADHRAPTPTAAAELVSPDTDNLRDQTVAVKQRLTRGLRHKLQTAQQRLDHAARGLLSPQERLSRERERVAHASARIRHALMRQQADARNELSLLRQRLRAHRPAVAYAQASAQLNEARRALNIGTQRQLQGHAQQLKSRRQALALLSPQHVLERGYSIVTQADARVVRDATSLRPGEVVNIRAAKGSACATISAEDN
jgi:exodeoxyribonuclease VII large subunit